MMVLQMGSEQSPAVSGTRLGPTRARQTLSRKSAVHTWHMPGLEIDFRHLMTRCSCCQSRQQNSCCIADAAACEAMYAEPSLPETCINLRLAHVLQDLQGGLPVALMGVGCDQGVVGHTAGLQACLVHVVKHILDLHGSEHRVNCCVRSHYFFLMLISVFNDIGGLQQGWCLSLKNQRRGSREAQRLACVNVCSLEVQPNRHAQDYMQAFCPAMQSEKVQLVGTGAERAEFQLKPQRGATLCSQLALTVLQSAVGLAVSSALLQPHVKHAASFTQQATSCC